MALLPPPLSAGVLLLAVLVLGLNDQSNAFVSPRTKLLPSLPFAAPHMAIMSGVDSKMEATYADLASRLLKKLSEEGPNLKNNQLFVGIAGGPGSGKSTLAARVADLVNKNNNDGADAAAKTAVVLPMDGFHFSRSQLKEIASSPSSPHTYPQLLARRGAPWTFDASACVSAFSKARHEGAAASLPTYSRAKSDPVPGGACLQPDTRIVLLEGNYLLAWDDDRWSPLRNVFDETWYVRCHPELLLDRLTKRHLETWTDEKTAIWGDGEEGGAQKKAKANDLLNYQWIETMSPHHADLIIDSL